MLSTRAHPDIVVKPGKAAEQAIHAADTRCDLAAGADVGSGTLAAIHGGTDDALPPPKLDP
jgi:hypothetical protein